MKKSILIGGLIILFMCSFVPASFSQETMSSKISIGVNGGYSQPMMQLAKRFKGTYNVDASLNYSATETYGGEFRLVFGKFDKLSSNPETIDKVVNDIVTNFTIPPELEHHYQYAGLTSSLSINLATSGSVKPYLLLGIGWYRYEYKRGPATPYIKLTKPADPEDVPEDWDPAWENYHYQLGTDDLKQLPLPQKYITEYAFGLNGAFGLGFEISPKAIIDVKLRWESILSDIWPTLWLGLEEVRPIHTLQLTAGIRFLLE